MRKSNLQLVKKCIQGHTVEPEYSPISHLKYKHEADWLEN